MKQLINCLSYIRGNCLDVILNHKESSLIKSSISSDFPTDYSSIINKFIIFKVNINMSILYYIIIKSIIVMLFNYIRIYKLIISILVILIIYKLNMLYGLYTFFSFKISNFSIHLLLGIIILYLILREI